MPDEQEDPTSETEAKPTITIAEKEGGSTATTDSAKPTITIAEKDGGK